MSRPGRLTERITFQRRTTSSDGGGGVTEGLANIATVPTVWAHVMPIRGTEETDSDRVNARGRFLFTIRNRDDIDETMTIVWRSVTYNIRHVHRESPIEHYLKIEAERGARV